jgi:hypothetical protein
VITGSPTAVQRRAPYESSADSVMCLQVVADCARQRGRYVLHYDAKHVERRAAAIVGARADELLQGPRA